MDIKEKVKQLPEAPGVYLMKDAQGDIMYVGKAKRLKNRVSQYFRVVQNRQPKILRMIEGIRGFDIIPTDTELEALLLECRLIKDLQPIYNSQLKNHQRYVYLWMNPEEQFPKLEIVKEKQAEGLIFGPYGSLRHVERALSAIRENTRIRHCNILQKRMSGCLNSEFGYCLAPCTGELTEPVYRQCVNKTIDFLQGKSMDIAKEIESKMHAAAESLDFDKAVKYRDDLKALQHLIYRGKTVQYAQTSRCIAAIEHIEEDNYKLFIIKGSRILYKRRVQLDREHAGLLEEIVSTIQINCKPFLGADPDGIEKGEIDQAQIVFSYLKNKKECSYIVIPKLWLQKKDRVKLEDGVKKLLDGLTVQA